MAYITVYLRKTSFFFDIVVFALYKIHLIIMYSTHATVGYPAQQECETDCFFNAVHSQMLGR
jgi:hypothetical protein